MRAIRMRRVDRAGRITPLDERRRAPQREPVTQRSAPRGAGCAVGDTRAWGENPGRRASSFAIVLPSRVFVCADLKRCSNSSAVEDAA